MNSLCTWPFQRKDLSLARTPAQELLFHLHQHYGPLTLARAEHNRTLRSGLRGCDTTAMRAALERRSAPPDRSCRQRRNCRPHDHQRKQLLPIHTRQSNPKLSGRNRGWSGKSAHGLTFAQQKMCIEGRAHADNRSRFLPAWLCWTRKSHQASMPRPVLAEVSKSRALGATRRRLSKAASRW